MTERSRSSRPTSPSLSPPSTQVTRTPQFPVSLEMNANAPVFVPTANGNKTANSHSPSSTSVQKGDSSSSRSNNRRPQKPAPVAAAPNCRNRNRKQKQYNYTNNSGPRRSSNGHVNDAARQTAQEAAYEIDDAAGVLSEIAAAERKGAYSTSSPGRKGQISLNHLLSFTFPPRQRPGYERPLKPRKGVSYQPYNKERFLNANFRFLVKSTSDYSVQIVDPDVQVEWDDIEEVLISSTTSPTCPVCLAYPTTPRVTKCGHVYCYVCILHYLSLADDVRRQWRKCPICWDAVYARDLRSVRFWETQSVGKLVDGPGGTVIAPDEGESVRLTLMQREVDSTIVLPRSATSKSNKPSTSSRRTLPWHFTPGAFPFAKLMFASPAYISNELAREETELACVLAQAKAPGGDEFEVPFIEMALLNLRERAKAVHESMDTRSDEGRRQEAAARIDAERAAKDMDEAKKRLQDAHIVSLGHAEHVSGQKESEVADMDGRSSVTGEGGHNEIMKPHFNDRVNGASLHKALSQRSLQKKGKSHRGGSIGTNETYFFFQAADGQHLYLHPLDIRVLKQEYGDYANFPDEVTVTVIEVEESTLTEELRRRCRYLSHLPLSCDVTFVEVEWKGLVGEETLNMFRGEYQQRQARYCGKKSKEPAERRGIVPDQYVLQLKTNEENTSGSPPRFLNEDPSFPPPAESDLDASFQHEPKVESGMLELQRPWGGGSESFAAIASGRAQSGSKGGASRWGQAKIEEDQCNQADQWWDFGEEEIVSKKGKKKLLLLSTGNSRRGKY